MLDKIRVRFLIMPVLLTLCYISLSGCGGKSDKPADQITAAIKAEMMPVAAALQMDMGEISLANIVPGTEPGSYMTTWSGNMVARETIAVIVDNIEGTFVVKPLLEKGQSVPIYGTSTAKQLGEMWLAEAEVAEKSGLAALLEQSPNSGVGPLSLLKPYVLVGSDESRLLVEGSQQRLKQRADREIAERAESARVESESRITAQRLAQHEQTKLQAARAEQDEQRRRAQDELMRRNLLAWLEVFRSPNGVVSLGTGLPSIDRGRLYHTYSIDEDTLTVRGDGIDLLVMPFTRFTFEGRVSVDDRGNPSLLIVESHRSSPVPRTFRLPDGSLMAGRDSAARTLALSEGERQRLDQMIEAAERAAKSAEPQIGIRTINPDQVASTLQSIQPSRIAADWAWGTEGAFSPATQEVFDGDFRSWKSVSGPSEFRIRFREPERVTGIGFYPNGDGLNNVSLLVNGVHRFDLTPAPRVRGAYGLVLVKFPEGTEIVELGVSMFSDVRLVEIFRFN